MPRPEVPDTGVLIRLAHSRSRIEDFQARFGRGAVWLSSVVLAEFLAGTRGPADALLANVIASTAARTRRLLTPSDDEWQLAGRLMARRIRSHGALRPRDHLNDLLILLSAARIKGTVATANVRHFEAWLPFARAARLDVRVREDPPVVG